MFVASIIPGPSMLLALTHGIKYGAKRTLASAMGNFVVTLIQTTISITGLGAILIASENVFQLIKWTGAAYLIYMGLTILFSSKMSLIQQDIKGNVEGISLRRMFMQGVIVTAGNPKAIIFFTAVFPQFIDPETASIGQYCILMSTGIMIAFGCFMLYAISGQKIISIFSSKTSGKYIKRVIGTSFIGAGIGLAVSNR